MQNLKQEKGISILFAISILSVILSIGLGTSSILIGQLKAIREIGYSVTAFYAADSGIEEILLIIDPDNIENITETELNGATYEVVVKDKDNPNCNAANFCIKSIGVYKGTRRAIEIKY